MGYMGVGREYRGVGRGVQKGRRSRVKKKYIITVLWNEVGVFLGKIVVHSRVWLFGTLSLSPSHGDGYTSSNNNNDNMIC